MGPRYGETFLRERYDQGSQLACLPFSCYFHDIEQLLTSTSFYCLGLDILFLLSTFTKKNFLTFGAVLGVSSLEPVRFDNARAIWHPMLTHGPWVRLGIQRHIH